MSLINYIEPVSVGGALAGLGMLIMTLVIAYVIYRLYIKFIDYFDVVINRDAKYLLLEESFLDKIAKEKGVNLEKELIKRKMFQDTKRKSFRRKVEEQIYEDMFGKEKKEAEK